jgi:hypothetical protein
MNDDSIVQFVGFITTLDFDKFATRWDYYVKLLNTPRKQASLRKQNGSSSRYKYISKHSGMSGDFRFSFMNKRESEHFPEHNAKVVHMGGYQAIQGEKGRSDKARGMTVLVFIKGHEIELNHYRRLPLFQKLNIYQAYFENCVYTYILEFFVKEDDAKDFIAALGMGIADEAALYEEFAVSHA